MGIIIYVVLLSLSYMKALFIEYKYHLIILYIEIYIEIVKNVKIVKLDSK